MDALHQAGEIILKEWGNTIPHATGDLESSLTPHATGDLESSLTVTDHSRDLKVTVSSAGPYAIRQELDDTLRHPDPTNPSSRSGRKAHAGRDALNNNRENIAKFVRDRMK